MNEKKLMESLNFIDQDMVWDAEFFQSKKRRRFKMTMIASAAAIIMISGSLILANGISGNPEPGPGKQPVVASVQATDPESELSTEEYIENSTDLPLLAANDTFSVSVSYEQDEALLSFCAEKKISDPETVCRLYPDCFGDYADIALYVADSGIWGSWNGKVSTISLGSDRLASAALADLDENGVYEMYYTIGSGRNTSDIMVYYPDRQTVVNGPYYSYLEPALRLSGVKGLGIARTAKDGMMIQLEPGWTIMAADNGEGELCAYSAEIQETENGGYKTTRRELLIDEHNETLIREGMGWTRYERISKSVLDEDSWTQPEWISPFGAFSNIQYGMTKEQFTARLFYAPDREIQMPGAAFLQFDTSVGATVNGKEYHLDLTREFRFDDVYGLYEVWLWGEGFLDFITAGRGENFNNISSMNGLRPLQTLDVQFFDGSYTEGVYWEKTAADLEEPYYSLYVQENGEPEHPEEEVIIRMETMKGDGIISDSMVIRLSEPMRKVCAMAVREQLLEQLPNREELMKYILESGLKFGSYYPEIVKRSEIYARNPGFRLKEEDTDRILSLITELIPAMEPETYVEEKLNTQLLSMEPQITYPYYESASLLQLNFKDGIICVRQIPDQTCTVYLFSTDEKKDGLWMQCTVTDPEMAKKLSDAMEEISSRTPYDRMVMSINSGGDVYGLVPVIKDMPLATLEDTALPDIMENEGSSG